MTTDTPAPRLLPCPFCGTSPQAAADQFAAVIRCVNSACGVGPRVRDGFLDKATDRWNTRQAAADLASAPTREELERVISERLGYTIITEILMDDLIAAGVRVRV